MNFKRNFIFYFFLICFVQSFSQKNHVEELTINTEIYPILKSLYGKIEVVDNRRSKEILIEIDTTGRFDLKNKYLLQPELSIQLSDFYKEQIGSISQYLNKKVLFVIHDFNVYREVFTNGPLYSLKCKGDLFLYDKGNYVLLKAMDTIFISSGGESLMSFFNDKSRYIYNFLLAEAETISVDSVVYSRSFALNLDSFFKLNNQLYNSSTIESGVYYTYARLAKSKPNVKFLKNVEISVPKNVDKFIEQNYINVIMDSIYAIVCQGKFYLNVQNKLYLAKRVENDYYFNLDLRDGKHYIPPPFINGLGFIDAMALSLLWSIIMNESSPKDNLKLETLLHCRTGQLKVSRQFLNQKNNANKR